jgi:hypothetical protein
MTTAWTDQASPSAKQDIASLLNVALDLTSASLRGGNVSRHFLVLMDLEGELTVRMGYGTNDVGVLVETVLDDYSSLRAILCVQDCGDQNSPRLRGFGDHRDSPPFDCDIDWRQSGSSLLDVVSSRISASDWWLFE